VTKSLYFLTAQKAKGSKMANYNVSGLQSLADLAHEAAIKGIPSKPLETTQPAETVTPCADNDKACTKRWIDSISDCC
jgi:hypothetical protein